MHIRTRTIKDISGRPLEVQVVLEQQDMIVIIGRAAVSIVEPNAAQSMSRALAEAAAWFARGPVHLSPIGGWYVSSTS